MVVGGGRRVVDLTRPLLRDTRRSVGLSLRRSSRRADDRPRVVACQQTQTAFQRRFVSYVKRCDELERKLRYFKTEIDQFGLPIQVTTCGDGRPTCGRVRACVCVCSPAGSSLRTRFAGVFFASNVVRWRGLRTWFAGAVFERGSLARSSNVVRDSDAKGGRGLWLVGGGRGEMR